MSQSNGTWIFKSLHKGKANIYSAGIETHGVNPKAIAIMNEDGIDISKHTSNLVTEYETVDFDYHYNCL